MMKSSDEKRDEEYYGKTLPVVRESRTFVTICILITELCERLTYYSINANLAIFLTAVLHYESADAVIVSGAFAGTCYFVPVFGGWVADSISGRYNAIFGSGMIYLVGAMLLPTAGFQETFQFQLSDTFKQIYFLVGLFLVAIGTGGIKANVGPFGAQQLEDLGPKAVQSFFRWYYWFINVGSAIAFAFVAYVQQEISFFWGYLIPALSIVLAMVMFILARSRYIEHATEGSVLTKSAKMILEASRNRDHNIYKVESFMDRAKESNGGSYSSAEVEGMKSVGRVIPVFITMIMYWTIYNQMQSTFLLQGERMNLLLGTLKLPAASLNLFNTIIILILVPIVDRLIFPLLAKFGKKPTQLQRIGFGLFLAAVSVAVAGILEIYRKQDLATNGGFSQEVAGTYYNSSNLTVMLQIPQFVVIGVSEVFTSITGLEFAYSQSPTELQGVVMGLFLLTTGLGFYLGSALIAIVNAATVTAEWMPNEINDGYVEYYFFLLSGLMLLDFIAFLFVASWYQYAPSSQEIMVSESSSLLLKQDEDATHMKSKVDNMYGSFQKDNSSTKL